MLTEKKTCEGDIMKVKSIGKNQTELHIEKNDKYLTDIIIFFSYETPVAACIDGQFFVTEKKWSTTTSKHINTWINGRNAEIRPQAIFDNLIK
jgi:hypothetical protein